MSKLKGVCIGCGYFSHFHYGAWNRIPEVEITAISDINEVKAKPIIEKYGISNYYKDFRKMLKTENPDFVDVITPPPSQLEICKSAADRGINVICQKPFATTFDEAKQIVEYTDSAGIRFMVHENFRFQPWHREIKKLVENNVIGEKLHSLYFRSRMGDGWGEDAYINRQPYFREMPRFLIYENGVHFIDTFRFIAGEIHRVYAILRKLNPIIAGEDCGILIMEFINNAVGVFDANRYNENKFEDPRYTFGEFLIEGNGGSIRLYSNGNITIQPLGEPERLHNYKHENIEFSGDCVYYTQRHFVDCFIKGKPFETNGRNYLRTLAVQEAVYNSAQQKTPVEVKYTDDQE